MSPDRIAVVGVGGGGCNAVGHMSRQWDNGPVLAAINTDAQALYALQIPKRIQIGKKLTRGMGAGGNAELGRLAAEDDFNSLRDLFTGIDIVFLVTALGGGTGTGASPVLARAAHETGALVIAMATLPFDFEGAQRMSLARKCLAELQDQADVVIAVPNQALVASSASGVTAAEAFQQADYILGMGVFALWKLLVQRGIMSVDFATLRTVARCSGGVSVFSYAEGRGPARATDAVEGALHSPLVNNGQALAEAESILVSILGGSDLALREIETIMSAIRNFCRQDAHLTVGTTIDPQWQDAVSVTIIASQFWRTEPEPAAEPPPFQLETGDTEPPSSGKRKKRAKPTQGQLGFDAIGKGIFKDVDPTLLNGEDLDIPTFHRRRVAIEK
jgi:cell division protein FtsZ